MTLTKISRLSTFKKRKCSLVINDVNISRKNQNYSWSFSSLAVNNKAFTLIEILAVIIILGIIALVVVPISSRYIFKTRDTIYTEHENSMKTAAENMTVECLLENNKDCKVPVGTGSRRVYLEELIESGYIENLKDPKSDSFCDGELSYVTINNAGESKYDYKVCLVCSEYTTNTDMCMNKNHNLPTCGRISTSTSKYTNAPQTITVECVDDDAGCTKRRFSKIFTNDTEEKVIKIQDNAGREVDCDVSSAFLIDKTPPTCTLKALGSVFEDGIYYGPLKVNLDSTNDNLSGIDVYGMGTTGRVMYDKTVSLDMPFGTTKVKGYVKDKAGNENICELTVNRNNDFKLIYDDNTGTGCSTKNQNIIYKHNYNVYGNLCIPTKTGYTFNGWYTSKTGGEKVENTSKMPNKSDTTIYARWTANTYTIAFNGNTNTGGATATKTCTYDEDCILPTNGFTKTGYLFLGWATESGGSVVYNDNHAVKNLATSGNVTLYAKWKAHTYTIVYNGNGATGGSMTSQVCYIDTDCVLNGNAFTRTGYTYDNWATSSDGGIAYTNGQTVRNIASGGGTINFYARWNINYYYLDLNGLLDGTASGGISGYGTCDVYINGSRVANDVNDYYTQHPYGSSYTINDCRATTGHAYNGVSSGSASGTIGAGNVSVQMKFTTNTYTIAFYGNGATGGSTAAQTCTYGRNCTLRSNGFVRNGYSFAGWATSSGGGVVYRNGASSTAFATGGTLNLYAKWIVLITNFDYTGRVQSFTAQMTGTYRLEVWGAQGGNAQTRTGGYGGYAIGNKYLTAGQTIYIVVGGAGSTCGRGTTANGGYNGGGNAISSNIDNGAIYYAGSGGGATHIATTNRGVLSNYNSYRGEVLIVAGGGGGANYDSGTGWVTYNGGAGGGTNGASVSDHGDWYSTGGSQTAGGRGAGFGYGGNGAWSSGGGGGGYFGGGMHNDFPGAGGSGYIGGVSSGSMSNGSRAGNGFARITFIQ